MRSRFIPQAQESERGKLGKGIHDQLRSWYQRLVGLKLGGYGRVWMIERVISGNLLLLMRNYGGFSIGLYTFGS